MTRRNRKEKGFTLIELMTALSLFAVLVTVNLGSILGVFEANRKSRALRAVMTDLNQAVETMSREMRYGTNYHCGSGSVTTPQNCASGGTLVSFLSSDNLQITYRQNGATFQKQIGTSGDWLPVIPPEVVIDNLTFYVTGAGAADGLQPKALITFKGHAGSGKGLSYFGLETLVSQRALDS